MAILGKVDFSPLRNVSQQKPRSLNGPQKKFPKLLGGTPSAKVIKFDIFS